MDGSAIRRTYTAHVPPQHRGETPLPIVFDLHIAFSSGFQQNLASEMSAQGAAEGFIVVQPDAWPWWAGSLMEEALRGGASDVEYIRLLLDTFNRNLCFDRNRIFLVGGNFIGFMAQALACASAKDELGGHRIAAVAAVSSLPIPTVQAPPWDKIPAITDAVGWAEFIKAKKVSTCPELTRDPVPLLVVFSDNDLRLATYLPGSDSTRAADQSVDAPDLTTRVEFTRLPINREDATEQDPYRVFGEKAPSPATAALLLACISSRIWSNDNGCAVTSILSLRQCNLQSPAVPSPADGWGVARNPIDFRCSPPNPRTDVRFIVVGTGSPDRNGHIWPGKPTATPFSATEAIWTFFSEHPR